MSRVFTVIMSLPAVLLLAAAAQAQNVRLVHPLGSDVGNVCVDTPCRTIGRAIEVAVPGDIVDIAAGEYTEILTIDKPLSLQGAGQENITIIEAHEQPGEAGGRVISITAQAQEVHLSDLVIRHGRAPATGGLCSFDDPEPCQGGGLRNEGGALTMTNVTVRDNVAPAGGGIYNTSGASAILTGVMVHGNATQGPVGGSGGGMVNADASTAIMENVTFHDNRAETGGGLTNRAGAYASLENVTFSSNVVRVESTLGAGRGGGMFNFGAADLINVDFTGNQASRRGGGLFNSLPEVICCSSGGAGDGTRGGDEEFLALNGVTFAGNAAQQGGAIYNEMSRSPVLQSVAFNDNQAVAGGGIIDAGDDGSLRGDFSILRGGGIYNDNGSPELSDVTFRGNSAFFAGGGMYSGAGSPVLNRVNFIDNHTEVAGGHSGGMYSQGGAPVLVDVNFRSNVAQGAGGGMTSEDSSPILTNVSFVGNTGQAGGGMHNLNSSPLISNAIFSGNLAKCFFGAPGNCNGRGGGMFNQNSTPRLINVTFSGNRAEGDGGAAGGGMFNTDETTPIDSPVVHNTVFWNNQDDGGVGTSGASISLGGAAPVPNIQFSLVQDTFPGGNGNLDGTDAGNDPLFLNMPDPESAPTNAGNLRLFPESPVIDAGNNAFVAGIDTDLDGNPRIIGAAVDLGAYEFTGEVDDVLFEDRFETVQ